MPSKARHARAPQVPTFNVRLVESSATELRLREARAFVADRLTRGDVMVIGATRGAADDLARAIARSVGATIGLHRLSLTQLAARLAAPSLAVGGRTPATGLGSEAVAARAAFEAQQAGALHYFEPVAQMPGFARALSRTLQELRLADVSPAALTTLPFGGRDLAALLERFEEQFAGASSSDRAVLFKVATDAVRLPTPGSRIPDPASRMTDSASVAGVDLAAPLLLLDVPLDSRAEFLFVRALMQASRDVLITVPFGDITALNRLEAEGVLPTVLKPEGESDLDALRLRMFAGKQPLEREPTGEVRFFSAPGEG